MTIEKFPTGKYKVVVIDPPWPVTHNIHQRFAMRGGSGQYYRPIQYRTMSIDDIKNLPIASCVADTAHVFCWTVQRYLPVTFDIIKAWGLTYRFVMGWHKNTGATMFGWPTGNLEFVVVGTKGKAKLRGQNDFKMCFNGINRGHSVKPAEFYNTLSRVTFPPRLDIFSRRLIPGFDVWGNEAPTETLSASQYPLFNEEFE